MNDVYNNLINDVAGVVHEGFGGLDTALSEAKNECFGNYQIEFKDILKENRKIEKEFLKDVSIRLNEWSVKSE